MTKFRNGGQFSRSQGWGVGWGWRNQVRVVSKGNRTGPCGDEAVLYLYSDRSHPNLRMCWTCIEYTPTQKRGHINLGKSASAWWVESMVMSCSCYWSVAVLRLSSQGAALGAGQGVWDLSALQPRRESSYVNKNSIKKRLYTSSVCPHKCPTRLFTSGVDSPQTVTGAVLKSPGEEFLSTPPPLPPVQTVVCFPPHSTLTGNTPCFFPIKFISYSLIKISNPFENIRQLESGVCGSECYRPSGNHSSQV